MPPPARPAREAFRRGLSAIVSNPGLILAPLLFALAVFASVAAPVLVFVFRAAGSLRPFGRRDATFRDPSGLVDALRSFLEFLAISPAAVLAGLLVFLLVLVLLTALAAYIRAGITGCLLAIDAGTPENAPLAAFRRPGLAAVFWSSARRDFGRFFALLNVYGLGVSLVALLVFLPIVLAILAGVGGHGGAAAALIVLFVLVLPPAFGASVALRILYLVAGRLAAAAEIDALEAVARAAAWTRASLSRAVFLYLLTLAAGFVTGFAFLVPRAALSIVGMRSLAVFAFGTAVILLAQILVALAFDLAVSGSFVALWPAAASIGEEKKTGVPAQDAPPVLV